MEDDSDTPAQTSKRPRPVVSCLNCRRKKLKCDRHLPCGKCSKTGRAGSCKYAPGQEPLPNERDTDTVLESSRSNGTETARPTTQVVNLARFEELEARVAQLEDALRRQIHMTAPSAFSARDFLQTDNYDLRYGQSHSDQAEVAINFLPRYLRDHFADINVFVEKLSQNEHEGLDDIAHTLHTASLCFAPSQSSSGDFDLYRDLEDVITHMESIIPDEKICTELIQLYFDNFESCLRILHRGTTMIIFRAYFNRKLLPDHRAVCIPTLLAVCSTASSLGTIPACNNNRLHGDISGAGAYQLLRNYLNLVPENAWQQLSTLQIALLTQRYHKGGNLTPQDAWQWSGSILRRAMAADMHRSSIVANAFEAELRRRVWLTALEMDLASAIASHMPATCPTWQDVAPVNIDDKKFWPGIPSLPRNQPQEEWTEGLCQNVLAASFNDRLQAYNSVAEGILPSYSALLSSVRHLEQILHDLPVTFRLNSAALSSDDSSETPERLLAKMVFDFLLRRPLTAVYAPYGALMPLDDQYKEARIMWIQNLTFSVCFQDLFDPKYPTLELPQPAGLWDFYHNVYKWDVDQFYIAYCLELQRLRSAQAEATDLISPPFYRHMLRSSLKVKGWNIQGLTNSLDETTDPLTRRLGRHGADLPQVIRWTAVVGALRVSQSCDRQASIRKELQSLASFVQNNTTFAHASQGFAETPTSPTSTAAISWLQQCFVDDKF